MSRRLAAGRVIEPRRWMWARSCKQGQTPGETGRSRRTASLAGCAGVRAAGRGQPAAGRIAHRAGRKAESSTRTTYPRCFRRRPRMIPLWRKRRCRKPTRSATTALIKTGDVSQSAYDKARTQADTAKEQANSARQLYEAAINSARQNFQGVINAQASLAGARRKPRSRAKLWTTPSSRRPFPAISAHVRSPSGNMWRSPPKIATLVRVTPLKLELAGSGIERAAVETGRRSRGQRSRLSGPNLPRHGDVHQSDRGLEFAHRFGGGEVRQSGPGAEARHVRHRAHSAERQQHGNLSCRAPRFLPIRARTPRKSSSFATARREWPWCNWAPWTASMIQILSGITADFVVATDHLAGSVTTASRWKSAIAPYAGRGHSEQESSPCINSPNSASNGRFSPPC